MIIIENEHIVMTDIDDTLLMWPKDHQKPGKGKVLVVCPYSGLKTYLKPHKKHINLIKKYHGRGMVIVAWSAAGYKWAEAAIKAVKLEDYITLVLTKPSKFMDDLKAEEILGVRVYLEDK